MGSVLILLGLAGLLIALVGLVRGRLRWARIGSRRGAAAVAASVAVLGGGAALIPSSPD